jgi:hypothetical protein
MAIERWWLAVPPQSILTNGTKYGEITVAQPTLFKVKQKVKLSSDAFQPRFYTIQRIVDSTLFLSGAEQKDLKDRADLTDFTTADNAKVSADEQQRPSIPPEMYQRAMYEEEPTVAMRTIGVGPDGKPYSQDNPMPTSATVNLGDVSIGTDGYNTSTPDSMNVTGSLDGTKTGVKRSVRVDTDGNVITKVINQAVQRKFDNVKVVAKNANGPVSLEYRDGGPSGTLVATGTITYDIDGDFEQFTVVNL